MSSIGRVAVITEGVGEFKALPELYSQLTARTGATMLAPFKLNAPPDAPPDVVARECKTLVKLAQARSADLILLILDREQQTAKPRDLASRLETAVGQRCGASSPVRVVFKDRAFENWLIADIAALTAQPARFNVSAGMRKAIEPEKADSVAALVLLKRATKGPSYDKVADAWKICKKMDVGRTAAHSRSFRHLLHVLGDPAILPCCSA